MIEKPLRGNVCIFAGVSRLVHRNIWYLISLIAFFFFFVKNTVVKDFIFNKTHRKKAFVGSSCPTYFPTK